MATIILEPLSPHYKRWCDIMLLTLHRYTLDDHVLSDVVDTSTYWARLDNIVLTWILSDEWLDPDLLRGRSKSIGGDLDGDEEGSEQNESMQSLNHGSIGYQSMHTRIDLTKKTYPCKCN
jgi:hypothetical protein